MSSSKRNRISSFRAFAGSILWVLLVTALGLAGCSGTKALSKRGAQLQQAGLYEDAANFYFNALMRNRNNVDARIGLAETGQRVLNNRLDEFSRARAMDEHAKAVTSFDQAVSYRDKINRLGVRLNIPEYMFQDFAQSRDVYIKTLYERGNDLMNERNFDEANATFREIARLDPNYKDIQDLKRVSRNEPIYAAATALFDAGRYREAYYEFDKIFKTDPSYKDVAVLRTECLNLGRFPIAVLPFANTSGSRDIERRLHAFVITELTNLNDPFLRVVERENMELILKEQRLSLSGIMDQSNAVQVGNLLNAKAIVSGTLLTYTTTPGNMRVTERSAFEAYNVKLYNAAEDRHYFETRYKPVKYREHYNQNQVSISFQYRGVSLETGEVLFSRIVERKLESTVYYATYDGEVTNLHPATSQGTVGSARDRTQLQSLLRANRTLRTIDELSGDAFTEISRELSRDVTQRMLKP
jgi:tetratricopeptide (TPR) repeat protein